MNEAALRNMIKTAGLKRLLSTIFRIAEVIDDDTAGQVVAHINSGGVTKVYKNVEVK